MTSEKAGPCFSHMKIYDKIRRSDLLLWLYCLGLAAFELWLLAAQPLEVDGRSPVAWAHLYSAHELVHGNWLGSLKSLALLLPPGYSFWIVFNHLLGLPLVLGSGLLLAAGGAALVAALRRTGVSRILSALLFTLILLDPIAQGLIAKASVISLKWPLILLAAGCYFLSTYQENRRAKLALWVSAGIFLALYWISFASPWLALALATWMIVWEFSLQAPDHSWRRRLGWILPLILTLSIPTVLLDLSIRSINRAHYGRFLLQREMRPGQALAWKTQGAPAVADLVRDMAETHFDRYLVIQGWAANRKSPIRKIELRDDKDERFGETGEFLDRPDVQKYLGDTEVHWESPGLKTGFHLEASRHMIPQESLRLVFFSEDGGEVTIGLENRGNVGQDFRYYLDSIEIKVRESRQREPIRAEIQSWYGLVQLVLGIAAVLGAILVAVSKLKGCGPRPVDFWLFLFSMLLLFCLERATAGGLRDYDMARPGAWPLLTVLSCQALLLLNQAWRFLSAKSEERKTLNAGSGAWSVERIFLGFALGFGLFFVFANPPFQAADEGAHAYRSFQSSQGESTQAPIPVSVDKVIRQFWRLSFNPHNKTSFREVWGAFKIPIDENQRGRSGSVSTSPIPHIPQAAGIFLGRRLGLPPLALLYIGRIFNLLAWTAMIFLAIRRLPTFKWVFFFLALSPMSLYQASSLSYDAFTNGTTFLLIATLLKHAFARDSRISNWQILELALIGALASLAKTIYFPLVLLYFWIPVARLGSRWRYISAFLIVFAVSLGVDLYLNMPRGLSAHVAKGTAGAASAGGGVTIFHQAWDFLLLVGKTFKVYHPFYLETYIGRLGWLDTGLPYGLRLFYLLGLLVLARLDFRPEIHFGLWRKFLSLTVFLGIFLPLFFVFWLTWTPAGSGQIEGIQGRYFIPIVPLLFLLLYNDRKKVSNAGLQWWAPVSMAIVLLMTGVVLLSRYYYLS